MVKTIVEKSGGSIAADSEGLGYGSVFAFSMNMHADHMSVNTIKKQDKSSDV